MRQRFRFPLVLLASSAIVVAVACGGGEEKSSLTATARPESPTSVVPTASTAATVATSPTAPPVTSGGKTGTILDKSVIAPIELDNVKYGGTFRIANVFSFPALDPKFNDGSPLTSHGRWFYEKLVGWVAKEKEDLTTMGPILAESWSASADVKVYTFKLRQGIKWQNIAPVNGRELVADDVVFSLNRYKEKDSINIGKFAQVESIEAPDKNTVVIRLTEANAFALNDMFPGPQYIVPPELVKEAGGTLASKAIGTGPYILKEFRFRQGASYVRNPNYWAKDAKGNTLPYTDAIEDTLMTDFATVVAAVRTGQLDMVNSSSLTTDDAVNLGKSLPSLRIFSGGIPGSNGITFNTKKAPWNDVRVRRAFGMMMNTQRYVEIMRSVPVEWVNYGPLLWTLVSDEPFTNEKLGPYYKYNPAEAKKLLTEAGFPGGRMKIENPMPFANPSMAQRAQVLQQLYKEEGIEFNLLAQDFSTYGTEFYQRSHKDLSLTFHLGSDFTLNWYAQNKFNPLATQNTAFIDDPEIDNVLREIKRTTDPVKQKQYAKALWDFDTLGAWNIYQPVPPSFRVGSTRLRNYVLRSGDAFTSAQIFPWLSDASRASP